MDYQNNLQKLLESCNDILLGKPTKLKLALSCILARGHLLIEDVPGVGKTLLAQVLAHGLGLDLKRIQLTSDLLPGDTLGNLVYNHDLNKFETFKGPIFSHFVLADELNRASPKTQSAFLEAMEERKVTIDKTTFQLPDPFIVFATQNPREQVGANPLPESQIDRFLMRISIGAPDEAFEKMLLSGPKRRDLVKDVPVLFSAQDVLSIQKQVDKIHVSDAVIVYIQKILKCCRQNSMKNTLPSLNDHAISPRAGIGLVDVSKAWAYVNGREMVLPDDVQSVAYEVLGHRISGGGPSLGHTSAEFKSQVIDLISVL